MMNQTNQFHPIKQWAENDQPREKLLLIGRSKMTNAELLAILLGTGTRNISAVQLSQIILKSVSNNLNSLAKLTASDLMKFDGIGEAKAISIITALELGRRRQAEEIHKHPIIQSSHEVFEYVAPYIADDSEESFVVLYMNNANKVMFHKEISSGGITSTLVDVRVLFRYALEKNATALILAHNHPSGKLNPSTSDIQLTKKIINGAQLLDIRVLDHVIVAEKGYFSFADEGMI